MSLFKSPILRTAICVAMLGVACDSTSSGTKNDAEALKKQAADKEAAAKKAKEDRAAEAKAAVAAQQAKEAEADKLYQAAKGGLEPFAKLTKKRPKGFGNACTEMLAAYDVFMKQSLSPDALAGWDGAKKKREAVMRRPCHLRPVDAVNCEVAVLKKAPAGTAVDHIVRLCGEKFE